MVLLHVVMVASGAVCVACAARTRPRASVSAVAGAVLMLLAMLDMAGPGILSPAWWGAALLAAALAGGAAARIRGGRAAAVEAAPRLVGVALMALLVIGAGVHGGSASGHHHGGPEVGLVAAVAALAYAGWIATALVRDRRHHAIDRASMAAMIAAMALMPAVA
ncbi:hypothetical protein [Microbacterium excoecariae]|uniref:hypothetical protein n=1 Tax=Microbacterium excoecariae TaxID=2715210 RepID=UPI00140A0547|nr:hypothetical protein [Microbacterium excoecariae]NHI15953.1 hypothetical protein [Microbacterium excoecariae]